MFNQGDIVNMDFNPQKGHEQAGYRPALIVSNNSYNSITGLYLVCPITNTDKDFPLHIRLDENTRTTGVVLCEHVKALDLIARNATFKEHLPDDLLNEVLDIIYGSIEREENC
jgi:mRNA interferase MazF